MSRQPNDKPIDLGINHTPRRADSDQVMRTQSDVVRIRQERERNIFLFFQTRAELRKITFTSNHDLTISDLRTIDPSIVMVDIPDPNKYPKEYFIGVPKGKIAEVVEKLRLKKEINSVNNEVTTQGKATNNPMSEYRIMSHGSK